MAKRVRSNTDPLLNKLYRKTAAEREQKTKIAGKSYAVCKHCGPQRIENFYMVRLPMSNGARGPGSYCKACSKIFCKTYGASKRNEYKKSAIVKVKSKYANDPEFREKKLEGSRNSQKYCRDNLTDGYVRKRIKLETGLSLDNITIPMILQKREELKDKRRKIEEKRLAKENKTEV